MFISKNMIESYCCHLRSEERSRATAEKYRRELLRFAAWLEGREASKELTVSYKRALAKQRTAAGVNGAVTALNSFFDFTGHPDWKLKAARVQRKMVRDEGRELDRNEYNRLVEAARRKNNQRLMLVMETICATGIRVSELQFFTVEAVRLGRAEVNNKGKARTVFLPAKLQKVLLKYAKQRGLTAGPVFVTRNGKPLDRSNIWRDMRSLCREAGVAEEKVFPHNLRHLFARTFYQLEKDIVHLADILGHSSVNTTRIYTMETGKAHRALLDKLKFVV